MKRNCFLILLVILLALPRLYAQQYMLGIYSSICAENGMFGIDMQLNSDMTFKYEWGGDMQDDKGIGEYKIDHDTVLLSWIPSKYDTEYNYWDTLKLIELPQAVDSGGFHIETKRYIKKKTPSGYLSPYVNDRPTKYYYKNNKLFGVSKDGKVVCPKTRALSRYRRFLLFGKHYYTMRKYYLVKTKRQADIF